MWLQTARDWALAELASGNLLLLCSSPPEQPYHGNTELGSSLLQWTFTCRNVDRNTWNHVSEVSSQNYCGYALSASIGLNLADACTSGWCNLGGDSCPALQGSSPEPGCLPVWGIAKLEGKLHMCWSLWAPACRIALSDWQSTSSRAGEVRVCESLYCLNTVIPLNMHKWLLRLEPVCRCWMGRIRAWS